MTQRPQPAVGAFEHRDARRPQPRGLRLVERGRDVAQHDERLVGVGLQPLHRVRVARRRRRTPAPGRPPAPPRRRSSSSASARRQAVNSSSVPAPVPHTSSGLVGVQPASSSSASRARGGRPTAARRRRRRASASVGDEHALATGVVHGRDRRRPAPRGSGVRWRTSRGCRPARRGRRTRCTPYARTAPPRRRPPRPARPSGRRPSRGRWRTRRRSGRRPGCRARPPRRARPAARRHRASSPGTARRRGSPRDRRAYCEIVRRSGHQLLTGD